MRLWDELKHGTPGHRFQSRYRKANRRGVVRKWMVIVGGALLVLAGIVFLPLPGPGILIIAFGAFLMAEESRAAARALDWIELRIRSVFSLPRRSR